MRTPSVPRPPTWARGLGARARGSLALLAVGLLPTACAPPADLPPSDRAAPAVTDVGDLASFVSALPETDVPTLDREMALALVAMPLSCLDRPHAPPRSRRTYLDTLVATRLSGFERTRAFYGCWDWHSAVNSTWAMVKLYKEFPEIPVAGLIEEKLDEHLSADALEGEVEFFRDDRSFERPYGWAWLLALHAELQRWDHPDAPAWASRVRPLASMFSERMVEHLTELKVPSRVGVHGNTSFALAMMLQAARDVGDYRLEQAIEQASLRLYSADFGCPTAYEPWGSDFLSPCLEEAALMAAVLDTDGYVDWMGHFLPPVDSREFAPLTSPTDPADVVASEADDATPASGATVPGDATLPAGSPEDSREAAERRFLASTSHLIGLAFLRADAMNRIADALPDDDPRVPALRRIARLHGARGFDAMFDARYAGSHWIGTFALKYLLTERSRDRVEPGAN